MSLADIGTIAGTAGGTIAVAAAAYLRIAPVLGQLAQFIQDWSSDGGALKRIANLEALLDNITKQMDAHAETHASTPTCETCVNYVARQTATTTTAPAAQTSASTESGA